MRVRALKTTHGSYGALPRGCIAEVPDYEAKEMIALGYMIEELPLAEQEAANDNIPLSLGGQTGADVPPSLSPEARAPETLTSVLDEDSEESGSSPSTTDTNSAHGQTHSTPATTTGGKRKRGRPSSKG